MIALGLQHPWARDLQVCLPARPCADYPPYEADLINLTFSLTPSSPAIAIGCFAALGIALLLVALGLRPHSQRQRPGLGPVALSATVTLLGLLIAGITDLRFTAISAIYGLEGSGGPDFDGSWWLVNLAGQAMTAAGLIALLVTATVAVLRSRATISTTPSDDT